MATTVIPAIPASQLVNVIPSVLPAGGDALDMIGLILTQNTRLPIGEVLSFATADDVTSYFGALTQESALAEIYFSGPDNATVLPGALLFAQYPASAVSAWLRGGNLSGLSLAALQTLSGIMTVVADGTTHAASINLSSATSYSSAAALIQTAFNTLVDVTGSIALNRFIGSIAPNTATGSILGTTLTVTAVGAGSVLAAGQTFTGANVVNNTTIVAQLTGTAGGVGTYQVSISQPVPSTALSFSGGGLTVTTLTSGTIDAGQAITAPGVASNTIIGTGGTGVGGTGTYPVSVSQTVASELMDASGGTLTVTAVTAGTLAVNDLLAGSGITAGNKITKLLTGLGGTGTYLVSLGEVVPSGTISVAGANVLVTYDSLTSAFVITSATTGVTSTMGYVTGQVISYLTDSNGDLILDASGNPIVAEEVGTLQDTLRLTQATGAILSQGADATTPSTFLDQATTVTQNWVSFMTTWEPVTADKEDFAIWTNAQENRYVYEMWDSDVANKQTGSGSPAVALINAAQYSGICMVYEDQSVYTTAGSLAAFGMGWTASLDWTRRAGRQTAAFKGQSGLPAEIFSGTEANELKAKGVNFYGDYTTANQAFIEYQTGRISGAFVWKDSYVNQIRLNTQLQLSIMVGLQNTPAIPYNRDGYTLSEAFMMDPINEGVNYGSVVAGVDLSASQITLVNRAAGLEIAPILKQRGWYSQVSPASAQVRRARTSPPCTLWYCDGGSIQQITLASISVQ